ncbi:mannitol dehydrogenase family protein [Fodinicurvata sp. EGI_FJ10296]|uniref:mannitol dehydrogenase family protein n=1 Tax=Fodinicurvata sp. EGI_FJ10296 TaxID=3231908 RepID=UPI0034552AC9
MSNAPVTILQFGTSRFLQGHVDLFAAEAAGEGQDVGRIAVVQSTSSPRSTRRVEALNREGGYPVVIRGNVGGTAVDREVTVDSIARAYQAATDWAAIEHLFITDIRYVVSNTGDSGYALDSADGPKSAVPTSFPAKLLRLLQRRFEAGGAPLTIMPCELINRNGDTLRGIVSGLAEDWGLGGAFTDWLAKDCLFVNSLVDRIASEAIEPVGVVVEPYALWAVEHQPGLVLPFRHPAVETVDQLLPYERLKLFILNLGHTVLADRWLTDGRPADETVRAALGDDSVRAELDTIYDAEVLPVFAALGMGDQAAAYRRTVMVRFLNPFLDHRLADIAGNHADKKERRIAPLIALARDVCPDLPVPGLESVLGR